MTTAQHGQRDDGNKGQPVGLRTVLADAIIQKLRGNSRLSRAILDSFAAQGVLFFRETDDHGILFYPNDVIGRQIMATGDFARQSVRDLKSALQEHGRFRPGSTVLEIGANIGTQTIYFFRDLDCGHVVAIEPDPENKRVLERNLALNGLSGKCRVLCLAASDHAGQAEFTRDLINRGGSRLGGGANNDARSQRFTVEVARTDDILGSAGVAGADIGLIWLDVEGHELEAIRGMETLLRQHRPPIFLEYTPSSTDTGRNDQIWSLLSGLYAGVHVYSDGFHRLTADGFAGISTQVDLLAI